MIQGRMKADLQATAPGLVDLTTSLDTRWFLHLLTARARLSELACLEEAQIMAISRISRVYARRVRQWQRIASFARDEALVSTMIIEDARLVIHLLVLFVSLKLDIALALELSTLARLLQTIPGFGVISSAEIAGEIGTLERFPTEWSLAMYLGMAPLDRSSGHAQGGRSARQVNTWAWRAMLTGSAHHARLCPESRQY